MNTILMILGGIIIGIIFNTIYKIVRNKIISKLTGKPIEKWDTTKFLDGITNITSGKKWGQTLSFWLNFRNWIIILLIAGVIYGAGIYKGQLGKPVNFNLDYDKEFTLQLDGQKLHKPINSSQLEVLDAKGNKIKVITAGDIPELQKKLKPYGIDIKPFFTVGYGSGERHTGKEAGVGTHIFKYFKWHINSFLTNRGVYLGVDYRITDNSGAIAGYGKGYSGDSRSYIGWMWRF